MCKACHDLDIKGMEAHVASGRIRRSYVLYRVLAKEHLHEDHEHERWPAVLGGGQPHNAGRVRNPRAEPHCGATAPDDQTPSLLESEKTAHAQFFFSRFVNLFFLVFLETS